MDRTDGLASAQVRVVSGRPAPFRRLGNRASDETTAGVLTSSCVFPDAAVLRTVRGADALIIVNTN